MNVANWQDRSELYEALMQVIRKRRSHRGYDSRPVSKDDIIKIIDAARWAPSGANIQPWEFLVIQDPATVRELAGILKREKDLIQKADPEFPAMGREFHDTVGTYILVLGDTRLMDAFPRVTTDVMEWTFCSSLAAATMNMHLAAASLGLGSVWLTVHRETESQIRRLLDIPEVFRVYTVMPLGYPARSRESWRRSVDEVIHWEGYDRTKFRSDELVKSMLSRKSRALLMAGRPVEQS